MNKFTVTSFTNNVPNFSSETYAPDNSQNARRTFTGLVSTEFPNGMPIEVSEFSAPSDNKGVAKVVARVRYHVPQMRLMSTSNTGGPVSLSLTGQSEFFQATLTVTVPAFWAKILLGTLPVSSALRIQAYNVLRCAAVDALTGVFADTKPGDVWTAVNLAAAPTLDSPVLRACQGANPEDMFNGTYGQTGS